ncbi:MAG TPA: PP0621 family protein [Burkholderiaceae bacterium]
MRLLIWLIVGLAVVVWLKRFLARAAHQEQHGGAGQAGVPRQRQSEAMVQCAHCGVHFPASEALAGADGAVYCSTEHRQLARQ